MLDIHERTEEQSARDRIRTLLRDVEIFVSLRQRGRNMVELMVMILFAVLTTFVALFMRPLMPNGIPDPYIGFTTELFAIAFASAIGFMAFDLFDRRVERDSGLLRAVSIASMNRDDQPPGWRLNLDSITDPTGHRIFAVCLSIIVFAVFSVLLGFKWF